MSNSKLKIKSKLKELRSYRQGLEKSIKRADYIGSVSPKQERRNKLVGMISSGVLLAGGVIALSIGLN